MTKAPTETAEKLVEMLLHLGRLAHGDGKAGALTSAQWTALRYFADANQLSRTPSGFAKFHATTRGTASQTIRTLVKQGYLTQSRAQHDGRSRCLDLTDKARDVRRHDPYDAVARAAARLPADTRRQFNASLEQLLDDVAGDTGENRFGCCTSCCHLECLDDAPANSSAHLCCLTKDKVENEDLALLCVNFEPIAPDRERPAASPKRG